VVVVEGRVVGPELAGGEARPTAAISNLRRDALFMRAPPKSLRRTKPPAIASDAATPMIVVSPIGSGGSADSPRWTSNAAPAEPTSRPRPSTSPATTTDVPRYAFDPMPRVVAVLLLLCACNGARPKVRRSRRPRQHAKANFNCARHSSRRTTLRRRRRAHRPSLSPDMVRKSLGVRRVQYLDVPCSWRSEPRAHRRGDRPRRIRENRRSERDCQALSTRQAPPAAYVVANEKPNQNPRGQEVQRDRDERERSQIANTTNSGVENRLYGDSDNRHGGGRRNEPETVRDLPDNG
jgi:hypothetical protein